MRLHVPGLTARLGWLKVSTCRRNTVVSGKGKFVYGGGEKSESFTRGEAYFMPAHLGAFEIVTVGATEIVVSYVE